MREIDCRVCVLRPWRAGDEEALVRHADNVNVWRGMRDAFPHPYRRGDARQWIRAAAAERPPTHFAIVVDGEAAGGIGYQRGEDVARFSAEVGYWLGEAHWDRGITSAALRAVTEHAFHEEPDLIRLYALPFTRNTASLRVLEKCGYAREGILRRSAVKEGEVLDQAVYAILR